MAQPSEQRHTHEEAGLPDLRLPVGLFFTLVGIILIAESFANHAKSAGIPIDLAWGVVQLVFGILMTLFGRRAGAGAISVEDEHQPG